MDIAYSRNRDAKIVLDKALTIDPGDKALTANCIEALGDVHQSLSELPQARRRHEEALPIYRDIGDRVGVANCIKALGDVDGEDGKLDGALAHFVEAAQRFNALGLPENEANCYNSIGNMFNNSRCYPEALAAYGKAIELYPRVNYYSNRAEPHMHLGDYPTAQHDLDAAAALNPDYDYLHFNRGRLALWQGQAQAALEHFDRALAQCPEYGEFHLWRALALALSGAAWESALQAGLERTHLVRQIEEAAAAFDKLAQSHGTVASAGLRGALQAALAARVAASGQHVPAADADTRQT